jgi:hypothetical protein
MKINSYSLYIFPPNLLLELLCHPQFLCDRIFENAILVNLVFLCGHATGMFCGHSTGMFCGHATRMFCGRATGMFCGRATGMF